MDTRPWAQDEPARRRPPRPATGHGTRPFADARGPAGTLYRKTARPRRCGRPARRAPGKGRGSGARASSHPSSAAASAPPPSPAPCGCLFQHGLHARTEARSLGEQAASLGQRVVFRINARFRAVERQPALPASGRFQRVDGSASGRNTVSSSCHPLGRTPVIRRVRFTLHPIRVPPLFPSFRHPPRRLLRRVSRCLSDQFISSDFLYHLSPTNV